MMLVAFASIFFAGVALLGVKTLDARLLWSYFLWKLGRTCFYSLLLLSDLLRSWGWELAQLFLISAGIRVYFLWIVWSLHQKLQTGEGAREAGYGTLDVEERTPFAVFGRNSVEANARVQQEVDRKMREMVESQQEAAERWRAKEERRQAEEKESPPRKVVPRGKKCYMPDAPRGLEFSGHWVPTATFTGAKSFGFYSCCREWQSAHAFPRLGQECKTCRRMVTPEFMWVNTKKAVNVVRNPDEVLAHHECSLCEACKRQGCCVHRQDCPAVR
eukprot:CAMPEP_0114566244 /NCGR_PEP_ID=MMETSP0114-20121206/14776_1 /TAXON_ID=31324 /ORGANISM="Goniomonas sp, Strain m" /LENGTH=272 /DNA_ID=CAMNT_0001752617 /DNA_START=228 /DNA_END=1046 /DNA_ORIENTATION=-